MQFDKYLNLTQEFQTVWTWENAEASSYEQVKLISFSKRTSVKEILSVPYCDKAYFYKEWLSDEFLHNFLDTVDDNSLLLMESKHGSI